MSTVPCPSGQRSTPRKRVRVNALRGFKSHRHRTIRAPSLTGLFDLRCLLDLGGITPFAKRRQLMTVPTGTAIAPIALSDLACNVRKIISGIWGPSCAIRSELLQSEINPIWRSQTKWERSKRWFPLAPPLRHHHSPIY